MRLWMCDKYNSLIGDGGGGQGGGTLGLESRFRETVSSSFPSSFALFATGSIASSSRGLFNIDLSPMLCGIESPRCTISPTGGKRVFSWSDGVVNSSQRRFVLALCNWDCSRMIALSITMALLLFCRRYVHWPDPSGQNPEGEASGASSLTMAYINCALQLLRGRK